MAKKRCLIRGLISLLQGPDPPPASADLRRRDGLARAIATTVRLSRTASRARDSTAPKIVREALTLQKERASVLAGDGAHMSHIDLPLAGEIVH